MLHALVISVITFVNPDQKMAKKESPKVMDVVLFDPRTMPKPAKENDDARTIANKTVKGNPKHAQDKSTRRAKAPPPAKHALKANKPKPKKPVPKKPRPVHNTTHQAMPLIHREKAVASTEAARQVQPKLAKLAPKQATPNVPLANLMPSSMALSEISRDFERERRLKQMLSNEADIPINTREAKYAPYAHGLVRALEEQWRPGEADYRKYTDKERQVLMRLTIEYNGKLGNLEILQGSPIPSLNESAVEAVYAAAPFKPLPRSWGLDRASFYLTFEVVDDKVVFKTL